MTLLTRSQTRTLADALSQRHVPLAAAMRTAATQLSAGDFTSFDELQTTLSNYATEFAEVAKGVESQLRARVGEAIPASFGHRKLSLSGLATQLDFESRCSAAMSKIHELRSVTSTVANDPALAVVQKELDQLEQHWRSAEESTIDSAHESCDVEAHPIALLRELVHHGDALSDSAWLGAVDDLRDQLGGGVIAAAIRQRLRWPGRDSKPTIDANH